MGLLDNMMLAFDQGVTGLFGQWNIYTTALTALLVGVVSYRIATGSDPDTHPMLLARQAQASPVRQEGASPVYRSHNAPHGMPLNSGLNVKDPGVSKWAPGRDGDLRDVWRKAATGVSSDDGKSSGKGRILTVHGAQQVIEHKLEDVTRQINLIGQHIHQQGGIRVAIYLPNSVELVVTLFACAFYQNLTAILIPFDVSHDELISMLRRSAADTVITAPGAFPFDTVVSSYPALRNLVWVVDEGSRHMDWNEVPAGIGGSVNVATWQDIMLFDHPAEYGTELPAPDPKHEPKDVVTFWQSKPGQLEEMVRFTQANLVSGIAAQLAAIPTKEAMGPADLFLPADSLTNAHTLVLTLAALFSNASVAFNSVAGRVKDLSLATRGISPTIIVASPLTLLSMHESARKDLAGSLQKWSHWAQTRSLTQAGVMPGGASPGKLRLVFVAEKAGAGTPALPETVLSDLRIFLGARIVYALTAAKVAGAVTQTGFYDYRVTEDVPGKHSHFGPPLSSTEIYLRDTAAHKSTDEAYQGEIVVRGPCVSGNEAGLGVAGKIRHDNTLAYV